MLDEKQNLLDEIEDDLFNSDFDSAADACRLFLEKWPKNVKAWWFYILADCGARNKQDIADLNIDIEQNEIFIKAVATLGEDKSEKLYAIINSIKRSKREGKDFSRTKCINYFVEQINAVKAELEEIKSDISDTFEKNGNQYKNVYKKCGQLYGNNIFGFFMTFIIFLVPFEIISVLLMLNGVGVIVSMIPIAVGAIIVFIRVIIRLLRHKRFIQGWNDVQGDIEDAEERLLEYNNAYKSKNLIRKKMMRIYKSLKNDKKASSSAIIKYRKEFEKLLRDEKVKTV
ncbi:MAG: hypothetical protein J5911_05165 [Clostridia bacterium]|nr:hypothetical protein [Clostridia bacterium]